MKLDLADDLWGRLYGAYGNRFVNKMLQMLSDEWDLAIAQDLFWEELHHQDDIYPVTFAALPWLVDLAPPSGEGFSETYLFLSHVIHCACRDGGTGCEATGPRGLYRGLSTDVSDHQHSWIPQSEWLTPQDLPRLRQLETWFSENAVNIAEQCLSLISDDIATSAYALEGFATINGSTRVASSAIMFADGEYVATITDELAAYDEGDSRVVAQLYPHLRAKNAELLSFLLNYPGCQFVPNDPSQEKLF